MGLISKFFRGVVGSERAIDAGKLDRTRPWNPASASATEDLREIARVRARARDLYYNNDLARSLVDKFANAVVGYGIVPRCASAVDAFNELVDRRFARWATNPTPDGGVDFYGLQYQVELAKDTSGECFVVQVTPPKSANAEIPLWLKVLEADLCDENKNEPGLPNGNKIVQGIEFDRYDRVVAYYFHHNHPGDPLSWLPKSGDSHIRMRADEVIHVWDKFSARPSQVRGLPKLTPIVRKLRALESFERAELTKQEVAACFGIAIEGAEEGTYNSVKGNDGKLCDSSGRPIDSLYPGMTAYLPPGATVHAVTPPVLTGYADYVGEKKHGIASGFGVPYAVATGDLTKVNFSSSRYGQGVFIRLVGATQWLGIIPQFCERVWSMWITAAYESGSLQIPQAAVEWTTQPFPSVNPLQDAQADIRRLRMGATTITKVIADSGENPKVILNGRIKENEFLDANGLTFDSDPRYRTQAGTNQPVYDTNVTAPAKKKVRRVS